MAFSPTVSLSEVLTTLDYVVIALGIAVTIGAIYFAQKGKAKSVNGKIEVVDYLIMGRRLTLPLFVTSLVATWYGGIFGVTEIAFKQGVYNFVTQGVFWYVTYFIFAIYMVPKIRGFKSLTFPALIGDMYGPKAAKVAAVFNFFNVMPVAYTISIGLLVQVMTGWSLIASMGLGTLLTSLYALYGGMRADVYTDFVQCIMMCLAVLCVVLFSVGTFGGLDYLQQSLPASHFSPAGGEPLGAMLAWGFIALGTLVDPNFYQRCFAAKDTRTARVGVLISILIWMGFDICTTLGGMYARAAMPTADGKLSYLFYGLQVLPSGFRGLFLTGLMATILSTLDSFVFIAGTTVSYDLGPKKWRDSAIWNHFAVFSVGVISIALAMSFDGSIKTVWKTLGSYWTGCLVLPVLFGFFRPGLFPERSFIFGSIFGMIAISYWRNVSHEGIWVYADKLYIGMAACFIGMILGKVLPRQIAAIVK